jgi:cation diffusion facilitator family transporter
MTVPKSAVAAGLARHHFAALSIAAAILTILLKAAAWWLTGSVGLLSDALESFVNLAGACVALWMVVLAARPPDDEHPFGHAKAEYFSSGFEGVLIMGASIGILWAAVQRLVVPQPLEALGLGMILSVVATAVNFGVAQALARAARRFGSVALAADSRHLMTDVVTSVGVVIGIAAVVLTGWQILDPLIAIAVGLNILFEGTRLLREAADGLMDRRLDDEQIRLLQQALDGFSAREIGWRALRTRRAGSHAWIDVVIEVPGHWTVERGHAVADEVESALMAVIPQATVLTHVEPHGATQTADAGDRTDRSATIVR